MEIQFIKACENGDIKEAKKLYSLGETNRSTSVNIYAYNDCAFRCSCENGQKEIAQWLYSLGANIHVENDSAFRWSCYRGHNEIAQWLYSLGANIHADDDYAFRWSCSNGHKEIAQWLIKVGKFNDKLINDYFAYYDNEMIKQIFNKGYKSLNNKMEEYYKEYIERKREIEQNTKKYLVPELVDLVYDYE